MTLCNRPPKGHSLVQCPPHRTGPQSSKEKTFVPHNSFARLLLVLPFALLAACDAATMTSLNTAMGIAPEVPPGPPPLPVAVAAVLPPGTPASIVIADGAGCYLIAIEVTDPPSGIPLRDAAGNRVCDGAAIAAVPVLLAAEGT